MIFKALLITLFVSLFIQSPPPNTCKISGDLENMIGSDYLYILEPNNGKVLDFIEVTNGQFSYSMQLEKPRPVIIYSKRHTSRTKFVWLEASDIKLSGNYEFINNLKVEGSKSHQIYSDFTSIVKSYKRKINKAKENINWDLLEFKEGIKTSKNPALQTKLDSLKVKASESIMNYLKEHNNSVVSLELLYSHCFLSFYFERLRNRLLSKNHAQLVYDSFPKQLKSEIKADKIKKYLQLPEIPKKVGDIAIDFEQKKADGTSIKLSELKGKYVLLYFWSTRCKPCIAFFPEMKKLYSKYQNNDFEIFSISGDRTKDSWLKIIHENNLPWIDGIDSSGIDLAFNQNKAFNFYEIYKTPTYLLVDKQGKVIAGSDIMDNPINNKEDLTLVLKKVFGF